jgi:ATP-dependent RNA helicase DDX10/DBP4
MLERLSRERWGLEDGLGALIISPTRELAMQIFEVIRIVGKSHILSAGLITGGKKEFAEEQLKILKMNILVATPGRLLQVRLIYLYYLTDMKLTLNIMLV